MTIPQLSIILPTYNEREHIALLITTIFDNVAISPEIIVVDDNSPDKTWEVVHGLLNRFPSLKLIRRDNVRGLASAIFTGIDQSSSVLISWMDCDFSHPPALFPKLLEEMNRADVAIASRFIAGGGQKSPWFRSFTSRIFNHFTSLILGPAVKDWTSGYAIIRKDTLKKLKTEPLGKGYGEYFIGLMFQAYRKGYKIVEVPYTYVFDDTRVSKTSPNIWKLLSYGFSYGLTVIKLRLRSFRGAL